MKTLQLIESILDLYPEYTREDWHATRRNGIGGSETAAILGVHEYMTAVELFIKKWKGEGVEGDELDNITLARGHYLEPFIFKLYEHETKNRVFPIGNRPLCHPEYPYIRGTLDALSLSADDILHIVEAKSVVGRGAYKWYKEIPKSIQIQIQKYMFIVGVIAKAFFPDWDGKIVGDLAILVDDEYIGEYNIQPDPEMAEMIFKADKYMWEECILPGNYPEPQTLSDIRKIYHTAVKGRSINADDNILELLSRKNIAVQEIAKLGSETKTWQDVDDAVTSQIMLEMKDSEVILLDGEIVASWRNGKSGARIFRIDKSLIRNIL